MNSFHKDGRGEIVDESGKEASVFVVDPSSQLTNLTNFHKYVKNKKVIVEMEGPKDTDTREAPPKEE